MYLAMYIHSTIRIFLDKKAETDCLYYIYPFQREVPSFLSVTVRFMH